MKTKHRLGKRMAAIITTLCMIFTMLPINALAFNPDWYKTHITSVSIGTPTTDLNGKKYLPVTVNFSAEEDISDSNAVYFLEGYLLATLKDGRKSEGINGLGMTLIGPLKPDALVGMGSNAYSWNWKGWEEGGGEGVLKYNIPLLEDSDTQTVEQSPYTGQQEVNGLQEGDKVALQIETVMNTNTIPADILPEGGSLMSDEFTVVIEDVSQYPKDITTSGGSCKHDGEKIYGSQGDKKHNIICKECEKVIGEEEHVFIRMTDTFYFENSETHKLEPKYGEADVCTKCGEYTNFVEIDTCKHDGKLAYINQGSKGHDIECEKCNEKIGSESHSFTRHLTGYFDKFDHNAFIGTGANPADIALSDYGEADVCAKCNACINFAAAKDLTKATPAVEEGKAYTQDEAKNIPLKDEDGNTVDKDSYTVTVEQSKTDENKWVVIFDPVSGKSTGKKTIEVKKACEHDGELTYYTKDTKVHCVVCKKCNQELGVQAHEFTVPIDAYLLGGNIYTYPVGSSIKGTAMKCSKCNQCTDFKGPCNHVDANKDEKCDICGADLHQHSYTSKVTKAATCTEEGEMTYTCKCGFSYTDDIPTVDHKYVETVVAPTEDAQGYTLHTCTVCGDSYKDNYTDKLHKHSYTSKVTKAATCTKDGVKTFTCSCGDSYTETIPATGHKFGSWTVTKKATCTATGTQTRKCTVCGATETKTIAKTAHTYKKYTTKATLTKNGSIVEKCIVCRTKKSTTTIYYPKTFTLAKTSYVYNGKVQRPTVTVKGANGKVIPASNYTVTYSSGCKNVGKYAVKVTFKGNYSGAKMLYYTIIPKGTAISRLTAAKRGFTAVWAKNTTQTTGYQIQYTTDAKFKSGVKTVTINKNTTVSKAISKLTGGKKYYVRVRTYRTANKVNYFSAWSGAKAVTTKK